MPRVVVAEPSAPISAALRKFLAGSAEVVFTPSVAEALVAARAEAPDVVMASVSAHAFEAETLCPQLRRLSPTTSIVLIYPPEEEHPQDRARMVGADAFVVGPVKKWAVLNALRTALQVRSLRSRVRELEQQLEVLRAVTRANPRSAASSDEAFLKKYLLLEIRRSKRHQYPVALMLLQLENTSRRAPAVRGAVLRVASLTLRGIDLVMPFGDDSFLIFLPHTPRAGSAVAAERMLRGLAKEPLKLVASVGVASFDPKITPQGNVSFGALVKDARGAMKAALRAGGGRVELAPVTAGAKRDRISMG